MVIISCNIIIIGKKSFNNTLTILSFYKAYEVKSALYMLNYLIYIQPCKIDAITMSDEETKVERGETIYPRLLNG